MLEMERMQMSNASSLSAPPPAGAEPVSSSDSKPWHKPIEFVPIAPPPAPQMRARNADFAAPGEKRTRYSLPESLDSASPVGFRTRVNLRQEEAQQLLRICSLPRPERFVPGPQLLEKQLFEESALGSLIARQSTNFRGFRDVVLGDDDAEQVAHLMQRIGHSDVPVLDHASHVHVVLSRPYRTPFTMLLTFIGHQSARSLWTVPARAARKRWRHADDIPSVGYLQQLHLGTLADAMERASVIASRAKARCQVHMAPCVASTQSAKNALRELEALVGLSASDKREGWHIGIIGQVGYVEETEQTELSEETATRLGAALLSLRSERIQPGVNQETKAPAAYQERQDMDASEALTFQCGRALYNAFAHFTGMDREQAKECVMLERVDVLTPNGKERLRAIRQELEDVSDRVVRGIPLWADLPLGRALSRNAARGKKAFALAGQRIYISGLSRTEMESRGLTFDHAIRAFGAAASRAALVAEISGTTDIPEGCDMLGGVCLMAGPVNQNDIGKAFFGNRDLLADAFPSRAPTSLLVWTLKAKTVADPIGNEEQLMNPARKGALVDLRPGPHEVVFVRKRGRLLPLRKRDGRVNQERAFACVNNFVTSPGGREIPGNRGSPWPQAWANEPVFSDTSRYHPNPREAAQPHTEYET